MGWQDGEPQQSGGCAYVDVDGTWRTTSCDTKLQGAVCGVSRGEYHPLGPRLGRVQVVPEGCVGRILNPALRQGPLLPEG